MSSTETPTDMDANLLDTYMPPLKTTGVPQNVVNNLTKFCATQERTGISLVDTIAKKKEFSNPAILKQVIDHYGLDEKGSNISANTDQNTSVK